MMAVFEDFNVEPTTSIISITPIQAHDLKDKLEQKTVLITANQRLARFRLKQYETSQIAQGKKAWQTPHIVSWSVWLQELWVANQAGVLLSSQQEALFWRDVVGSDEEAHVLNAKALAKQAMDAWQILSDYAIDTSCLLSGGEEHIALHRWAEAVQVDIQQQNSNFVQRHELLGKLEKSILKHCSQSIILDGFDTLSPKQVQFLTHLQDLGYVVYEVSQETHTAQPCMQTYHDEEHELRLVCQKIRQNLEGKPNQLIGLFVPDLEQRASTVRQILSEELAPELSLKSATDLDGAYFNLSMGSVLAKQPLIQSVMRLLSLTVQSTLDSQTITGLLYNPYLKGFTDERVNRATLDKHIRANNNQNISLSQLLYIAQHDDLATPIFEETIQLLNAHLSESKLFSGRKYLSAWLEVASQVLEDFSCFDNIELSFEIAQLQGWKDMLHQLSCLDDFCGKITWAEALGRLQEQAFEQIFRPAPGLANIQVMGFLEASNLKFDEAFIISMDDHTWPPAARPHPLIPVDIQVKYQTPHANSDREWLYAQTVWQNLMHVAPILHVSYAKTRDNQDVQPSPLLLGLEQEESASFSTHRFATQLQAQQVSLVDIDDATLSVDKVESIRGGTGVLASQSACSFQAFAKYRLKLEALEQPTRGLNSREQGILLHQALENFWQKNPSQKLLIDFIDAKALDAEIQSCISNAWASLHRLVAKDTQWLEERRLSRLIRDWLLLEAEREPFKVIEREVWRDVQLGGLVLHTKLDRIDVDKDGHRIILDYKTGESVASKALGERPDAPQLPAYLLAEQAKGLTVDAIAFAQVRMQGMGFKGFAKEDKVLPKLKAYKGRKDQPEDWDDLTQHWQETLHNLADEFMAGEAIVAPKNTQSCTYCDFSGLCRIQNR